ncbi:conserved hypothetical protein [Talaromyces stipitatus ATCC 10500]|uniref:DASH complex subunit DAD1 n=1 Tax=Talaromyces stipitatus (strain ATCC 10500 / CBS 375.48 / QM 6759 / NRRL 1006) TaxID=441959 RepID=B8MRD2_TALSN|nr:uncharacterized protein TSTA_055320 [Talaromyces stipitatus ATCC 10500]EED13027.1 conserved hypothetical protein [Talaromyces stipitatus ATCC 10500]
MSAFATSTTTDPRTEFEIQRSELVREIALGMESVLQYINRLNRNLESIIAVGNEFSSVEALWSHFENVMGSEEGQQTDVQKQDDNNAGEEVDIKQEEEYGDIENGEHRRS